MRGSHFFIVLFHQPLVLLLFELVLASGAAVFPQKPAERTSCDLQKYKNGEFSSGIEEGFSVVSHRIINNTPQKERIKDTTHAEQKFRDDHH